MNYFLHAELTLRGADVRNFKDAMVGFLKLGGFAGTQLPEDLLPLQPAHLFEVVSDDPARLQTDFIHLWTVPPTSLDLATAMNCLPNNIAYRKVDKQVSREQQEYIYLQRNVESQLAGQLKLGPSSRFVRVVHECEIQSQATTWLVDCAGTLRGFLAAPESDDKRWVCVGVLWSVTGRVRTVTDFWQVPEGSTKDDVSLDAMMRLAKDNGAPDDFIAQCRAVPETSRLLLRAYATEFTKGGE